MNTKLRSIGKNIQPTTKHLNKSLDCFLTKVPLRTVLITGFLMNHVCGFFALNEKSPTLKCIKEKATINIFEN